MSSKQGGFFKNIFGRKKSNKENELPLESNREHFQRAQSVRGSSRRQRSSKYQEDVQSPDYPNPYHGAAKPRTHPKGPQSCPGGYREDPYHDESYEENRTSIGANYGNRGYGKHDKFRRSARDTSEYGSGDPSPIANFAHQRYNTQNYTPSVADDSDPEVYYDKPMRGSTDLRKENEWLRFKLEHETGRHLSYKTKCAKLKSTKDNAEQAFNERVQKLQAENEHLMNENRKLMKDNNSLSTELQKLMRQQQQLGFQQPFFQPPVPMYSMPPVFSQPPFATPRYQPNMTSSGITPGTSGGMESSTGAGEAMAQQGDMSFRPESANFDSSLSHRDEDEDDIKNFSGHDDAFEAPRGNISSSSLGLGRYVEVPLIRQCNESHASNSTMVADSPSPRPPTKSDSDSTMRRTASDGVLN